MWGRGYALGSITAMPRRLLLVALAATLPAPAAAGPRAAADCAPHPAAVVAHGAARFTVLTERVIRMERAPFVDDCTLTIVRRATPTVPAFTHALSGDVLRLETAQLSLVYNASADSDPTPAPSCAAQHDVQQLGGARSPAHPDGLVVADAAACCAACSAAGASSCGGWIFKEANETSRKRLNCWPMRTLGKVVPTSAPALARTIGSLPAPPAARGFSAASLSITLRGGATWRPGMGSAANLGGTVSDPPIRDPPSHAPSRPSHALSLARLLQPDQISSWNEVPPRSLLVGNQTYQPGILSRDGWAIVDDTETPRFTYQPPLWEVRFLTEILDDFRRFVDEIWGF